MLDRIGGGGGSSNSSPDAAHVFDQNRRLALPEHGACLGKLIARYDFFFLFSLAIG